MCVESTSILDHNDANVRYRAASALIDSEARAGIRQVATRRAIRFTCASSLSGRCTVHDLTPLEPEEQDAHRRIASGGVQQGCNPPSSSFIP